mmetsp:Transcript_39403/g.91359  ORF Transcript_39403/g.91359 Transcript_39403/m.91359 type:complete len:211 (-) Transcript_39403:303-935(-)
MQVGLRPQPQRHRSRHRDRHCSQGALQHTAVATGELHLQAHLGQGAEPERRRLEAHVGVSVDECGETLVEVPKPPRHHARMHVFCQVALYLKVLSAHTQRFSKCLEFSILHFPSLFRLCKAPLDLAAELSVQLALALFRLTLSLALSKSKIQLRLLRCGSCDLLLAPETVDLALQYLAALVQPGYLPAQCLALAHLHVHGGHAPRVPFSS